MKKSGAFSTRTYSKMIDVALNLKGISSELRNEKYLFKREKHLGRSFSFKQIPGNYWLHSSRKVDCLTQM
jgi:hypothetical protein